METVSVRLPAIFERYRDEVDQALKKALVHEEAGPYDMLRYHMGWVNENGTHISAPGGKAIRPSLCLLACEAVGGSWRSALSAATALELVHNFSLIHDDIQDGDKERRHRPTVWYLWGEERALTAGTTLGIIGNLALLQYDHNASPEKILKASHSLSGAIMEMIEGQCLDITYEERMDITVADYLTMISKKTGALMECALHLGALFGTEDIKTIECLSRYGRRLGLVFQIKDDILGTWGKEGHTGKPIAADIRRRKKTLPVVYVLNVVKGSDRERLYDLYTRETLSEGDVEKVLIILDNWKAREYCQKMAEEHCSQAMDELKSAKLSSSAKRDLKEVMAFLLEREH